MKDRIPLSNGKNNNIKLDLTGITSWDEFLAANTAGTLKADVFANNDGTGTEEVGTALNKANLLSDATATKLGLDPDNNPTVNDAFSQTQDNIDNIEQIGDIKVTARTDLGDNWLLSNGAYVDYDTYTDLFNAINPTRIGLNGYLSSVQTDYNGNYSTGLYDTIRYVKIRISEIDYIFALGNDATNTKPAFSITTNGINWTTTIFTSFSSNGYIYDMVLVGNTLVILLNTGSPSLIFASCPITSDIGLSSNWSYTTTIATSSYSWSPNLRIATDGQILACAVTLNSNNNNYIKYANISSLGTISYYSPFGVNSTTNMLVNVYYNTVDSTWYLFGRQLYSTLDGFNLIKLNDFPTSGSYTIIDQFDYTSVGYVYYSDLIEFGGKFVYVKTSQSSSYGVYYHEKTSTSTIGTKISDGFGAYIDNDYLYIINGATINKYDTSFNLISTVSTIVKNTIYHGYYGSTDYFLYIGNNWILPNTSRYSGSTRSYVQIDGSCKIPTVTTTGAYTYVKALD